MKETFEQYELVIIAAEAISSVVLWIHVEL